MTICGITRDLHTMDTHRNPENADWVTCTLEKGHDGDHIAHGVDDKCIRWKQK